MKLLHSLEPGLGEIRLGAITIGNFDGVHHGHARILKNFATRQTASMAPQWSLRSLPTRYKYSVHSRLHLHSPGQTANRFYSPNWVSMR